MSKENSFKRMIVKLPDGKDDLVVHAKKYFDFQTHFQNNYIPSIFEGMAFCHRYGSIDSTILNLFQNMLKLIVQMFRLKHANHIAMFLV